MSGCLTSTRAVAGRRCAAGERARDVSRRLLRWSPSHPREDRSKGVSGENLSPVPGRGLPVRPTELGGSGVHPSPVYSISYSRGMGEDEWDIYQTDEVAAWMDDLRRTDPEAAGKVEAAVDVLAEWADAGPAARRHPSGLQTVEPQGTASAGNLHPGAIRLRPVAVGYFAGRGRQGWPVAVMVRAGDSAGGAVVRDLPGRASEGGGEASD